MKLVKWMLFGEGARGILVAGIKDSKIFLDCVRASGEASCDWRCFDTCYPGPSGFMNVEEAEQCLRAMDYACDIPAVSFSVMEPKAFCSSESDGSEYYLVQWPEFARVDSLRVDTPLPLAVSLDVSGEFPSRLCQETLVQYTAGLADSVATSCHFNDLLSKETEEGDSSDVERRTEVSFGFTKMNINITQFVTTMQYSPSLPTLGDTDVTIALTTKTGCFAAARDVTLYYSDTFTLHSYKSATEYAVAGAKVLFLLLSAASITDF